MSSWHDLQSARAGWSELKPVPDAVVQDLLDGAKEACWGYVHPNDEEIPDEVAVRFRIAQLLHAQSVWQLPRGGSDGQIGVDGYATRVYVLGYDIQKILRPPVYGEAVG